MKKRVLLAAASALFLLAGCKGNQPTEYQQGLTSLEEEKYTEAIEYFQNAIQTGDQSVLAWRGLGIARSRQGDFERAEEAFASALKLTEDASKALQADLYLYLADAQYHQEDYQGCIQTCDRLLEIRKEEDGYFLRGSAYLRRNEHKKAEQDFTKVISRSRDYQDYIDIFKIYRDCELNADGVEYLEAALEIKGNSAEDFYHRGRVYHYLSDYEAAEKELKKAWKKNYSQAAVYLGNVYAEWNKMEKAEEMYEKCLETEGLEGEGYHGLAYCSAARGDYREALSYIEKGLETADSKVRQALLFHEIVFYEKSQDFESAKEKMAAYLEEYPADEHAVRENYFLQTR